MAKAGNANALARLADQAFGRPSEQDEGPKPSALEGLSRDELAGALAELDTLPEAPPADDAAPPSRTPGHASEADAHPRAAEAHGGGSS